MLITKLSHKDGKTCVRYLHEFEEREINTEAKPRPELMSTLDGLTDIVKEVAQVHPEEQVNIYCEPIEFTRSKKPYKGECIKITSEVFCGIHGSAKLVTPDIELKELSDDHQALVAAAVAEAELFARGKRAQMEFKEIAASSDAGKEGASK